MDVNRLEFLDLLGQGAFGKVRLARKIKDCESSTEDESLDGFKSDGNSHSQQEKESNYLAVKILSKHQLIAAKQADHIFNEISILQSVRHPFIVNCEGIA